MYWEDMQSKWGFSDGDAEPPDCWARRAVYVTAVNAIAERKGSDYRAIAFNRGGCHNSCIVLFVHKEEISGLSLEQVAEGTYEYDEDGSFPWFVPKPDEAFDEAVTDAMESHLDDFVTFEVKINTDISDIAKNFRGETHD